MAQLFDTYTLNNGVTISNRLVVAPMTHWGSTPEGKLSDQERTFLEGRAQGFGMFITAATLVRAEGKAFAGQPHAIGADDLPSLRETARLIQQQGAKAILQIHHGGRQALADQIGALEVLAPSSDPQTGARAMTEAEVEDVIESYGRATRLAIEAGFDGVEIHGANGYLIQQFYSGHHNRRTDRWGGDRTARMRMPLAVVEAVLRAREQAGAEQFVVGYRFSPEEPEEEGLTMEDAFALIDALVQYPLQYLHMSLHDFGAHARRGADTSRTRISLVHERIGGRLPLIGVGGLLTAQQIEGAMAGNQVDFVALGRAVLLNPNIVSLLRSGQHQQIETELDPERADRYGYTDGLWAVQQLGLEFMPRIKG